MSTKLAIALPAERDSDEAALGVGSIRKSEETHYRILRILGTRPDISQRELAESLGVSLGKANYCLRALLERSWVKAQNFRNSDNKVAYAYLLTPAGIEAKARLTVDFLQRKLQEYEAIRVEIDLLQAECLTLGSDGNPSRGDAEG